MIDRLLEKGWYPLEEGLYPTLGDGLLLLSLDSHGCVVGARWWKDQ